MDELLAAIDAWREGEQGWDDVVEAASGVTPATHKTYRETGWDHYADEFPQPGTLDELVAKRLTASQYKELVEAMNPAESSSAAT